MSYHGPQLFCDREMETAQLLSNARNGSNTTLLALRRMGKSSLLHHALHQIEASETGIGIYTDIFDTENLSAFTNRIASAMINTLPEKHSFWKKAMNFLKQLRPVISYDSISGAPQVTLEYARAEQYERSLESIFNFLETQNQPVLVVIDEFQQITTFPEKNIEALLRTQIQKLKNVHFIFSGSSPHLLAEMFHHTKRPFFSSTKTLELKEIDAMEYSTFIRRQFESRQRTITAEAIEFILEFTRRHTFYTQALCNHIYAAGIREINPEITRKQAADLLLQNEPVYYQYRTLLTANQWDMLRAIAKEDRMYAPTSNEIGRKYRLGSSSVIQRSLEALINKEMVYVRENEEGRYYAVYDCFLSRWLEGK